MANEITFDYKGYSVSIVQRRPNGAALIVVKDKRGAIQGWPYRNENSFIDAADFGKMLDYFWESKGAKMPDYE